MQGAEQAGSLASTECCAMKAAMKQYMRAPQVLVAIIITLKAPVQHVKDSSVTKSWHHLELVADIVIIVATTKHGCSISCTGNQEASTACRPEVIDILQRREMQQISCRSI